MLYLECNNQRDMSNINKLGYALGMSIGQNLVGTGVKESDIDFDDLLRGIKVVFSGEDPAIPVDESNQVLKTYFDGLEREMEEMRKQQAEIEKEKAKEFLANNKQKPGVKVTDSGLQYKVLEEGTVLQWPKSHSRVRVHYEGRLQDGTVFDSSYERNTPAEFGLNQVIPGWTEGVQLMKPGSKYEFYIPPQLGYGERGIPGVIPGNSVLIFTVELLDIINTL